MKLSALKCWGLFVYMQYESCIMYVIAQLTLYKTALIPLSGVRQHAVVDGLEWTSVERLCSTVRTYPFLHKLGTISVTCPPHQ